MIDLSAFNQKPGESWADIMDEEEEENDRSRHSNTDEKKQDPPESNPKPSGIVWRIPTEEKKKEQRQFLELLIERRQNVDSLDNWRRNNNDDNNNDNNNDDNDKKPWRSAKKYREPEKNNSSGWHAYSQVLQDEYENEREEARKEFIRRFGTAPDEDEAPKPTQPVVISVSADGPSDWADDLPSDEEVDDDLSDAGDGVRLSDPPRVDPLSDEKEVQHVDHVPDEIKEQHVDRLPNEKELAIQSTEPVEAKTIDAKEERSSSSAEEGLPEEDGRRLQEEEDKRPMSEQKGVSQQEEPAQSANPETPAQPIASTVSSSDGWRTGGSTDAAPVTPLPHSQDDTTVKIEVWRNQVATTSSRQSNSAWSDFAAQHSRPAMAVQDQTPTTVTDEQGWQKQSGPEHRPSDRSAWPAARSPRMQILSHLFKSKAPRSTDTARSADESDGPQRWNTFADQRTKKNGIDNTMRPNEDAQSQSSRTSQNEKSKEDKRASLNEKPSAPNEDDGSCQAAETWTASNDDALSYSSRTSHGKLRSVAEDDARSHTSRTSNFKPVEKRPSSAGSHPIKDERASPAWNAFSGDSNTRNKNGRKDAQASSSWNTVGNNGSQRSTNNGSVSSNYDNNKSVSGNHASQKTNPSVEDDSWKAAATWTTHWKPPSSLETNQSVNTNQPKQTTENQTSGESRWQAYAKEHSARIDKSNKPWS